MWSKSNAGMIDTEYRTITPESYASAQYTEKKEKEAMKMRLILAKHKEKRKWRCWDREPKWSPFSSIPHSPSAHICKSKVEEKPWNAGLTLRNQAGECFPFPSKVISIATKTAKGKSMLQRKSHSLHSTPSLSFIINTKTPRGTKSGTKNPHAFFSHRFGLSCRSFQFIQGVIQHRSLIPFLLKSAEVFIALG